MINISIREGGQSIWQYWSEKTKESIRGIAARTGIPKSSVARHQTAIKGRLQYPESHLWETPEGQAWLRLLVFAVIYCFGIKGGIGADSLSVFFHLLRLEKQIGCSASALRQLEVQVKEKIIAYGETQSELCKGENPIDICVGGDETFFGLPILVAIELASGFIFTETQCNNRTYNTWWEQINGWFDRKHWNCRVLGA